MYKKYACSEITLSPLKLGTDMLDVSFCVSP